MNKRWRIYCYTCISTTKKYIGVSSQTIRKRSKKDGKGYKTQKYFYEDILKYGWNNFQYEELFVTENFEEAMELERKMIKKYNSANRNYGYNETLGGMGSLGLHPGLETRQKMSNGLLGNKYTLGHKLTEEQKKKISNTLKGAYMGFENKLSKSVLQINIKTGEIIKEWGSLREIERNTEFCRTTISKAIKNNKFESYGYIWKLKKEES